jgi:hypothetical protein
MMFADFRGGLPSLNFCITKGGKLPMPSPSPSRKREGGGRPRLPKDRFYLIGECSSGPKSIFPSPCFQDKNRPPS